MLKTTCTKLANTLGAFALVAGFAISGTATHAALLDGKTVSFTYLYPTIETIKESSPANGNYLVGAVVEIQNGICCGFEGSLDFSDSNILVDYQVGTFYSGYAYSDDEFTGFRITDVLGEIDAFTSVSINALTNMYQFSPDSHNYQMFDASRISFDADNIWVNLRGLEFYSDTTLSLDITGSAAEVPAPGTLWLLGIGIAGLGLVRRKPRRLQK